MIKGEELKGRERDRETEREIGGGRKGERERERGCYLKKKRLLLTQLQFIQP